MYDDESNLEAMLNNPFQNLPPGKAVTHTTPLSPDKATGERSAEQTADSVALRMERNHPMELRVLGLEKDILIAAKRMDDLKRIVVKQNERIQLLEEELDILRKKLGKERE